MHWSLVIRTISSMHLARAWFRSICLPPCFALYISSVKLMRGNMDFVMEPCMLWSFNIPTSYVADLLLFNTKDLIIYCPDLNWDIGRASLSPAWRSSSQVSECSPKSGGQTWTLPHRWGVLWVPLFGPSPVGC